MLLGLLLKLANLVREALEFILDTRIILLDLWLKCRSWTNVCTHMLGFTYPAGLIEEVLIVVSFLLPQWRTTWWTK